MPPTLNDLINISRQAGDILINNFGKHLHVEHKSLTDLVSDVDRQSEQLLLNYIRQNFPGDAVQAEESGGLPGSSERVWYVDPLDGTVNYLHGIPIFSVSIAYAEMGVMRMGVVYDPVHDECFSAEHGKGAHLNGFPIHPATAADLDHALLVTGFSYDIRDISDNNLDNFAYFALHSQGVRRLGSAALDLCYVACGRLDGFWELILQPWDLAAGALIAMEAGARVTNIDGGPDFIASPPSVIAANPQLHPLIYSGVHRK